MIQSSNPLIVNEEPQPVSIHENCVLLCYYMLFDYLILWISIKLQATNTPQEEETAKIVHF